MHTRITLEDIGPLQHLDIELPEGGGVVLLRGANRAGKSTTLSALDVAAGGDPKDHNLKPRDGAKRGVLEGPGLRMTVGKNTRRNGCLELAMLSGHSNLGEFIFPGIKDKESADLARVKALLGDSDIALDAQQFIDLVGGESEWAIITKEATRKSKNPIEMGERVRRDLHTIKRQSEEKAKAADDKQAAIKESVADVKLDIETDEAKLQAALEHAVGFVGHLKSQQESVLQEAAALERAQATLKMLECRDSPADGRSPFEVAEDSLTEAKTRETTALAAYEGITEERKALEERLKKIAHEEDLAAQKYHSALESTMAAEAALVREKEHNEQLAQVKEQLAKPRMEPVAEETMVNANAQVTQCREAIEQAAITRKALASLEQADRHATDARDYRRMARQFREKADAVDEIYSDLLERLGTPCRWKNARMIVKTTRGEETLVDEMSEGEIRRLGVEIWIPRVIALAKKEQLPGVLLLPQNVWESFDPDNKLYLHERAKEAGIWVITAAADQVGPLRSVALLAA